MNTIKKIIIYKPNEQETIRVGNNFRVLGQKIEEIHQDSENTFTIIGHPFGNTIVKIVASNVDIFYE